VGHLGQLVFEPLRGFQHLKDVIGIVYVNPPIPVPTQPVEIRSEDGV
jgi:hypothetical protein